MKRTVLSLCILGVSLFCVFKYLRGLWVPLLNKVSDKRTVVEVISEYEAKEKKHLSALFKSAGIKYPPRQIALLGIKEDKLLELWARDDGNVWKFIWKYPILAASGSLGPKLREGDHQVPEGIYEIEYFNPNSAYHLSMKINYPNAFDKKWAENEGRTEPGSDIFLHGKDVSVGCLAMGDEAIEEIFVLSQKVGKENITVIISPVDPRLKNLIPPEGAAEWVRYLYENIKVRFMGLVSG